MSLTAKIVLSVVLLTLLLAIFGVLSARGRKQVTAAAPSKREVYVGLRNQIFQLTRDKCGLPPNAQPSEPCAAIMDWGVKTGTATVVAVADGTTSIYLSSGGGSIGGGQSHAAIREAGQHFLALSKEFLPQMQVTTEYPLPATGQVIFYVRTVGGVVTARVSEGELSSHRHPLSRLGDAAQQIITEYHLLQTSKQH
jgi:hypothetical protein